MEQSAPVNNSASNDETPSQALERELGTNAQSGLGLALLRYVKRWEETKNPHWIDLAIVIVTTAGKLIPPCLQIMASQIAMRRINGLEDAAGGASVVNEEVKGQAFALMALLRTNGVASDEAAKAAANATAAIFGSHLYKASTLEKEYGSRRKAEFQQWEALLKNGISQSEGLLALLMTHLEEIPDHDPGNRRL